VKRHSILILISLLIAFSSCKEKEDTETVVKAYTLTVDPSVTYQEMIGFGGALTWYSDRIISSPKKNEICKLLFEDLGTDMIRLKNSYYPSGYPAVKTTDVMETAGQKTLFNTANQLYDLARSYNPEIVTLLSSWGPSSALKSNDKLNNGTLKKDESGFMYEAFADYWTDILDHISFTPDYISIQNEPSWGTDSWESCLWRPVETTEYPGYNTAFDLVYNNISTRLNPPKMIGPEAENIGTSSFGGNTFGAFSDPLKDKASLAMYAFHTYNFSATTFPDETVTALNMIRDSYGNKPCIMTEYSGMAWLKTAQFITRVVNEANASAYLYWDMMWGESNSFAMMQVDYNGNYTLTPFYYLMKHFSKNVDLGYKRIDAGMTVSLLDYSAFISPELDKITIVIVNPLNQNINVNFSVANETLSGIRAYQTVEASYYKDLGVISLTKPLLMKPLSITTVVLELN